VTGLADQGRSKDGSAGVWDLEDREPGDTKNFRTWEGVIHGGICAGETVKMVKGATSHYEVGQKVGLKYEARV